MIEVDLGFDAEAARIRPHLAEGVADRDPDRLEDLEITAGPVERLEPDQVDGRDKGAALPSMIGASGPSISTTALSTPRPESAARTCSAVEISGPDASPSTVAKSVAVTAPKSAGNLADLPGHRFAFE